MKKIFSFLVLFFTLLTPVFANDVIKTNSGDLDGKILSLTDGIAIIKVKGVDHSFTRAVDSNYFGDYIKFRKWPLGETYIEANCHLVFMDDYTVKLDLPTGRVSIPRYRVNTLILNYIH